jgi:hypothetical protein
MHEGGEADLLPPLNSHLSIEHLRDGSRSPEALLGFGRANGPTSLAEIGAILRISRPLVESLA